MMFVGGVILLALGIAISIALHEAGHLWAARATGMKVRRYFIGFGPKIFSFHRGGTEYGLKAIPLGGFCDIAGMTALDEVTPEEEPYAMYKQKTWKRMVVMFGGIAMNVVLGFLIVVGWALGWGLPDIRSDSWVEVEKVSCVAPTQSPDGTLAECTGQGPAERAGIRPGDRILAVDGVDTPTTLEVVYETRARSGTVPFTIQRGDQVLEIPVTIQQVERQFSNGRTGTVSPRMVGAVGASLTEPKPQQPVPSSVLGSIPDSISFTGDMFVLTGEALVKMPSKVSDLWDAVTGGERRLDTPISVIGASEIGGRAAEADQWELFVSILAQMNFFLAAFNLLPLLPLDGGHIAVVAYEKLRDWFRQKRGLSPAGPFNYIKLMPATYLVIVVGAAYMLLTLAADIVNPIQLFR